MLLTGNLQALHENQEQVISQMHFWRMEARPQITTFGIFIVVLRWLLLKLLLWGSQAVPDGPRSWEPPENPGTNLQVSIASLNFETKQHDFLAKVWLGKLPAWFLSGHVSEPALPTHSRTSQVCTIHCRLWSPDQVWLYQPFLLIQRKLKWFLAVFWIGKDFCAKGQQPLTSLSCGFLHTAKFILLSLPGLYYLQVSQQCIHWLMGMCAQLILEWLQAAHQSATASEYILNTLYVYGLFS